MNVSWVIGNGEWANVPNTDGPIWSKASFGVKVQQAWEESSDFRADMLQAALRIDWCEEPLSTALSKLRDMFGLFEDVSTECVLRLAIWIESVFFGEDKPEEIRKIPDWREVIERVRESAADAARPYVEEGREEGKDDDVVDDGAAADLGASIFIDHAEDVYELIKERMPSLGLGPDEFAKRNLPRSLIGKDRYCFDEMVLIYKSLDKCEERRARENCLYDVWAMSYGTDALTNSVFDALETYADKIHRFLVPRGKQAYFVCSAAMPQVELSWKRLIISVLQQHYGDMDKAWYQGVSKEIRKAASSLSEEKKGERTKWECLYFIQLKDILEKNWRLFEPRIKSKKRFTKKDSAETLDRLNEIRNDLSHPTEGQTFKYADQLDAYLREIKDLMREVLGERSDREREAENA